MKPLSKIRKSARGQECQVRIPGVCNFNNETTVLAHLNGGGMGMKTPDNEAAYACSSCHDAIDGRQWVDYDEDDLRILHLEGVMRTQRLLIEQGLLVIK